MKKIFLTIIVALVCVGAMANISFIEKLKDSQHPFNTKRNYQSEKKEMSDCKLVSFNSNSGNDDILKSENSYSTTGKALKIDSIVYYNIIKEPVYDSLLAGLDSVRLNDKGLIEEQIKTVYDSIQGVVKSKDYFMYDNSNREIFKESFKWDSDENIWLKSVEIRQEYFPDDSKSMSFIYYNNAIPSYKESFEYNNKGLLTLFSNYSWDALSYDWEKHIKNSISYNEMGDSIEFVNYRAINNEYFTIDKTTYDYWGGQKTRRKYSWNNATQKFTLTSEDFATHYKEYNQNNQITYERYVDYNLIPINNGWEKRYYYDGKNRLRREEYASIKNTKYRWNKQYEFDDQDNFVFFLYLEFDTISENFIERQVDNYEYDYKDRLIKEVHEAWNKNKNILEKVRHVEYVFNSEDKVEKEIEKRGSISNKDWEVYSVTCCNYNSDNGYIERHYTIEDTGKVMIKDIVDEIQIFEYKDSINRYSSVKGKRSFPEKPEIYSISSYNDDLHLEEIYWEENDLTKIYYDSFGRDSLWVFIENDEIKGFNMFSYSIFNNDSLIITEEVYYDFLSGENPSKRNTYYYSNNTLARIIKGTSQIIDIIFEYSEEGLIKSIFTVDNDSRNDFVMSNDTLIIFEREGYTEEQGWLGEDLYYCQFDTSDVNKSTHQIPLLFWDTQTREKVIQFLPYEYGVISQGWDDPKTELKKYFYSETSPLIGDGVIEGYLFGDTSLSLNEIRTENLNGGSPVEGIAIRLINNDTREELVATSTNSEGFYKFRGIPYGEYHIALDVPEQIDHQTYDIKIWLGQLRYINQNFVIGRNSCAEFSNKPIITIERESLCLGEVARLIAPEGNYMYKWNNGSTSRIVDTTEGGVFNVVISDENGCSSEPSDDYIITYAEIPPKPEIIIWDEKDFCQGDSVSLWVLASAAAYEWSTGDLQSSIKVSQYGNYKVRVISEYGCTSEWSDEVSIKINSIPDKPSISVNSNELTSSSPVGNQWFLNKIEIKGATEQTYTIKETGNYSVQVSNENRCVSEMSDEVNVSFTSVHGIKYQVQVYPNPTTGLITISGLPYNETTNISVYNLLGEKVLEKSITGTSTSIDLTSQNKGVYFGRFGGDTENGIKIIKQ
jgi:hypothetical protein